MKKTSQIATAMHYVLLASVSTYLLPAFVFGAAQLGAEEVERIAITGSRLKKAEFDQAAPVQVLEIDDAVKAGVNSVADLLQRTSMAGGQQLDGTYNSASGNSNASEAPPSGGVGSSNIGLRGLGPERTLILVNGRRLGSSGVRGAPSQPDLSLLPLNMVDRIEVITEGASSIYGADAVAGVINIIMKRSFEGAQISANASSTKDGGGGVRQVSFVTGYQGEKSNFVVSMSYYDRQRVSVGQRAGECITRRERDLDGNVYDHCNNGFFNNAVLNIGQVDGNWAFYTPGSTDLGIMNWSTGGALSQPHADVDPVNPRNNYGFNPDYHDQWDTFNSDLIQPVKRFTLALNGTLDVDLFGGEEELFFEGYYFHRALTNQGGSEQNLPTVAGVIPHQDADGNLVRNEAGELDLVDNPLSPFDTPTMLVTTIEALSQKRNVELDHVRFVGGLRGDFTSALLTDKGWNYEMYASYDRGMGHQDQPVMHREHLLLATETLRLDVDGNPVCGVPSFGNTFDIGDILTGPDCVPVNFFAPSLFSVGEKRGGSFADQAAEDYLIATRTNRTVVQQSMFNIYASGDLFDFSHGGTALAAMGLEYRKDTISSAVESLGENHGNAAESPLTEGDTDGSRSVNSVFAEVSLPILVDQDMADLLEFEAAVRYTDESNFGDEITTRARLTYKPVDWVILSGSFGTSFRAPNLREQFLANQATGVSGDPCVVPDSAFIDGAYFPVGETRSQLVLDNCVAHGADPTVLGSSGVTTIPVNIGGNVADLEAETSDNITYSIKLTPALSDDFKLSFALTYYDIEIENTIRSIDGDVIMDHCFGDQPNLTSPFCDRLKRDGGRTPEFNFVNFIDASFVNIGLETTKGFDVNLDFTTDTKVFDMPLSIAWTNQYTQMTERELTIFAEQQVEDTQDPGEFITTGGAEDLLEDFGNAKQRLVSNLSITSGHFSWLLIARYISGTHANDLTLVKNNCTADDSFASTLFFTGTYASGERIRPEMTSICEAGSRFYLDTSLTWSGENLRMSAGVNNLFDKQAPRVDQAAGSNRGNLVTSSGYDLFGQTYFLNATYNF